MTNRVVSTVSASIVALGALVVVSSGAFGQNVASDRPAGLIIFPKVEVDLVGLRSASGGTPGSTRTDTMIQITNTSDQIRVLQCYYVDATGTCASGRNKAGNTGLDAQCRDNQDCCTTGGTGACTLGGTCTLDWQGGDFTITLSQNQPTGWLVSEGRRWFVGSVESSVPPAPTDYFIGELKCWEVNNATSALPVNRNDLIGQASIVTTELGIGGSVDAQAFNAVGIPAVSENGATQGDQVLCLGATANSSECGVAEYAQCPSTLIINHPFDHTSSNSNFNGNGGVETRVSFAPCTDNFAEPASQTATTAQFLVFNEFEQRFSASTRINCFREVLLSNIDQPPGSEVYSIWNFAVQGTFVGQTRVRGVTSGETNAGHGLLAISEVTSAMNNASTTAQVVPQTAAYNVNYSGVNSGKGDFIRYSVNSNP